MFYDTWLPLRTRGTIYFLASDPKTDEEKDRDEVKDDVFAFDENYKQRHLWKISVKDATEQKVSSGDFSVLDYSLSRDGRKVAFHRGPTSLAGSKDGRTIHMVVNMRRDVLKTLEKATPDRAVTDNRDRKH